MPNSYVTYTGTGSQLTFSFAGIDDYLSTGYIKVYLNNVLQTTNYSIDVTGGNENVVFTAGNAPASGVVVKIARETPSTSAGFASGIVDFANGSVLTADDLDKGFKGMLHIVQEANDTGSGALPKNASSTSWDAKALKITNGSMGTDAADFVTKAQLDAAQVYGSAITVPQAWEFSANGKNYTLSNPTALSSDPNMFIVEVGGVIQRPTTDYTIASGVLTFVTAPTVGIRVRNFGVARSALDALPSGSVSETYIAAGAVTETKLATNSVTADKLANNSVDAAAIQTGAVTAGKLGTDAVVTANITDLNVTESKLATGAVTSAKLGALSVTTAALGTGQITSDKIASSTVVYNNLNSASTGASLFAPSAASDRYLKVAANGSLSLDALSNVPIGSTATANVNMNTFKLTGLGAGTANGQAIRYEQVHNPEGIVNGYLIQTSTSIKQWIVTGAYSISNGTIAVNDSSSGSLSTIFSGFTSGANFGFRPATGGGTWAITLVSNSGIPSYHSTVISTYTTSMIGNNTNGTFVAIRTA
jgi:hypothetical protein